MKNKPGHPRVELENKRFGRLLVIRENGRSKSGDIKWLCLCDCGNTTTVTSSSLKATPGTKSCGCLFVDRVTSHGATKSSTRDVMRYSYSAWKSMKQRCTNPNIERWEHYGGRGITYDPRWEEFEEFYKDMGDCGEGLTLDRIDVDGNYCKENCRWADRTTQQFNQTQRKNNTSGRTGVSWNKRYKKWEVYIGYKNQYIRLGKYSDIAEAIKVREEAEIKYYGHTKK